MENTTTTENAQGAKTRKNSKLTTLKKLASVIRDLSDQNHDQKDIDALIIVREKLRKEVLKEL